MAAVPYCGKCDMVIDPWQEKCPKCGSPVRFKFLGPEKAKELREKQKAEKEKRKGKRKEAGKGAKGRGYLRPPSTV